MRNGNLLVQVRFYGFMENVGISYPYSFLGFLKLMVLKLVREKASFGASISQIFDPKAHLVR